MIVSNKKNFIFVHIPKTGGTSVTACLKKYASYSVRSEYGIKNGGYLHKSLLKHAHASDIKMFLDVKKWDKYFKFALVRNPWDLFVSLYFYLKPKSKTLQKKSFKEFITNFCTYPEKAKLMGGGQYPFIYKNGKCLVDFVGRYENYIKDINYISNRLGIKITLPHINKTNHKHYRKYYTNKTKKMLAKVCANDIEYFNYEF